MIWYKQAGTHKDEPNLMSVLITSVLGDTSVLLGDEEVLHHRAEHTDQAQESETLGEEAGNGGSIAGSAAASLQEVNQPDQQNHAFLGVPIQISLSIYCLPAHYLI